MSELQSRPDIVDSETRALHETEVVADLDHYRQAQVRAQTATFGPGKPQHAGGLKMRLEGGEGTTHVFLCDGEVVDVVESTLELVNDVQVGQFHGTQGHRWRTDKVSACTWLDAHLLGNGSGHAHLPRPLVVACVIGANALAQTLVICLSSDRGAVHLLCRGDEHPDGSGAG